MTLWRRCFGLLFRAVVDHVARRGRRRGGGGGGDHRRCTVSGGRGGRGPCGAAERGRHVVAGFLAVGSSARLSRLDRARRRARWCPGHAFSRLHDLVRYNTH
ncbi:hypothetical protein EMIHUDRAFT_448138, partial [Emiliania huxleyi CCMP1516]